MWKVDKSIIKVNIIDIESWKKNKPIVRVNNYTFYKKKHYANRYLDKKTNNNNQLKISLYH